MKDFFCTHFSIRIVFLITHAWKQEFPHPRSSQYLLQKYLKCFTVYSTSAHYRHDNSMKYFFVRIFSIRIVFLIIHAWKQEFPHLRYSQYPLQKCLRCFTVYSTSAHYRHDNRMKAFFCTHFFDTYCFFDNTRLETRVSTHMLFTISVAKCVRCFTVYSTSAHYRYDFRENTLLQKLHKICRVLKRLCCTASTGFNLCFQPSVFCWCVASGKSFCPSLSL